MDTSTTPPPEKPSDSTSLLETPAATLPSLSDPDFIPPMVKKPSNLRYLWLILIFGLVLSVVGVGAYIIDSENKKAPSQPSNLLTPTPDLPKPTVTPLPSPIPEASESAETSSSSAAIEPSSSL
jgi:hypothetical protein